MSQAQLLSLSKMSEFECRLSGVPCNDLCIFESINLEGKIINVD